MDLSLTQSLCSRYELLHQIQYYFLILYMIFIIRMETYEDFTGLDMLIFLFLYRVIQTGFGFYMLYTIYNRPTP